uniref:Cation-transporting P-type ATPase C-terminal domain-containing protein n=1 Tax=Zooxanthella nutricula TaxID=1333877 RepID=A0A7S2N709_9DINO
MVFGVPEALTIAQVLLIDIGTDIWTAIAFAFQPAESKLMARAPRHPRLVKLADWGVGVYSYCYIGMLQTFFCWAMYFHVPGLLQVWADQGTGPYDANGQYVVLQGKSVYYWTLVIGQIAAAVSATTERQSLLTYCFPNTLLNLAFAFEVALGLVSLCGEFMHGAFSTTYIPWELVVRPLIALVAIVLIDEARKLVFRRLEEQNRCGWCLGAGGAAIEEDDWSGSGSSDDENDSHEDGETGKLISLC